VLVDVDDTIIEVHGYAKQGSGYGYSGVRGLNALLATVMTAGSAPVIVGQRLRRGACGSSRGAARLVTDALSTLKRMNGSADHSGAESKRVLLRADSAFYGHAAVGAAVRAGADVSVTMRQFPSIRSAISAIDEDAWQPIEYTDAVFDQETGRWVSRAEVAEIPLTAFATQKHSLRVPGRLVVRRIPDLNPHARDGQATLFDTWRFHAFFTTTDPEVMDTVTADKTHRGHAIIEQVHADPKSSALAHLPSGRFNANAAWLVLAVIAFHLTRAPATLTGPTLANHHRHHPPQSDQRARPSRQLGPTAQAAPTHQLALGTRLDRNVHPRLRTASTGDPLTIPPTPARLQEPPLEHPGCEAGRRPTPDNHQPPTPVTNRSSAHGPVDRGLDPAGHSRVTAP
jgi:Transposase DDE domain